MVLILYLIFLWQGSSLCPLLTQPVHSNTYQTHNTYDILWFPDSHKQIWLNYCCTYMIWKYAKRSIWQALILNLNKPEQRNLSAYCPGTSEAPDVILGHGWLQCRRSLPPAKVILTYHKLTWVTTRKPSGMVLFCLAQAFGCYSQASVSISLHTLWLESKSSRFDVEFLCEALLSGLHKEAIRLKWLMPQQPM